MTKNDYMRIISIIRSTYRADWLDNEDILTAFFNFCLQYDYETCKAAVIDLVENGSDDGVPVTLAVIENRIRREAEIRKKPTAASATTCRFCGGLGFTLKTYPSGRDYLTPCNCPIGRERFPSYFWTPEEEEAYWDEKKRHGISKPHYITAPPEVHRQMKYDEHAAEIYERRKKEWASGH